MKLTGLIAEIVAYLMFLATVFSFTFIAWVKRKDIWNGAKGENNKLETPELIVLAWLILFIVLILVNLFFGLELAAPYWVSMDLILAYALGIRTYRENKRMKFNQNKPTDEKP